MSTLPLSPPVRPSDLPRPPKGYNHALLLAGEHSAEQMLREHAAGNSLLVLQEAEGARGVLNALQIRMGPIKLDAPKYTLAHFLAPADGHVAMHVWSLTYKGGAQ